MKYVNPLSFLSDQTITANHLPGKKDLLLQKKKLLAEIELSERQTVLIKETELNKDDVLKLFDGLQNPQEILYHASIAADAVLYDFLTTGQLTGNGNFAKNPLYDDAAFKHFISPFFKDVFTTLTLKTLRNDENETLAKLWKNPVLLEGRYYEQVLNKIRSYLFEQSNSLVQTKNRAVEKGKARLDEFLKFFDANFIHTVNVLPQNSRNLKMIMPWS